MATEKRISQEETLYPDEKAFIAPPPQEPGEAVDDEDPRYYIDSPETTNKEQRKIEKNNKADLYADFAPEGWKSQILPLFSTPVFIVNPQGIPLEKLKGVIDIIEGAEYKESSAAGYQYLAISENKQVLEEKQFSVIKKNIMEALNMYLKMLGGLSGNFFIKTSWIVKSRPGDKSRSHTHPNSIFSGVYYIQTDANCGDIIFEYGKPFPPAICTNMDIRKKFNSILNSPVYSHTPQNNQIVLFPSDLMHRVAKNKSSINRISIAFDIYLDGVIGSPGNYWMETKVLDYMKTQKDKRPWENEAEKSS